MTAAPGSRAQIDSRDLADRPQPLEVATPDGGGEGSLRLASDDDSLAVANMDPYTMPLPDPLPPPTEKGHVLLTGATGFLGVHLLHQLAVTLPRETDIYALVRADSTAAADERLRGAFRNAHLPLPAIGPRPEGPRVIPLAGYLEQHRLGLSDDLYDRLAVEIGLVYHVAAQVSFDATYAELRPANVEGTRRVLELATTSTLKAFHLVSSVNVAALIERCNGTRTSEDSRLPPALTASAFATSLGYSVSKWTCERMLQRLFFHSGGRMRASISRPALITWSQATGVFDETNWVTRVLSSCLLLRCAIGPDETGVPVWVPETAVSARGLDMVPVDFVARAIGRLGGLTFASTLPGTSGGPSVQVPTYHVSNTAPEELGHVTFSRLMDLLVAADLRISGAAGAMQTVAFSEWAERVEMEGAPALAVLPQLRRGPVLPRASAERFTGVMALPGLPKMECPPIDQSLVEAYVRNWYRKAEES